MTTNEAIEILRKNRSTSDPRRCGKELCEALDMAISALRAQQTIHVTDLYDEEGGEVYGAKKERNDPLTLEQLRKMDGEPVWVVWPDGRIKSKWWIVNSGWWMDMFWDDHGNISNDYGTVWVAYRQKPEE